MENAAQKKLEKISAYIDAHIGEKITLQAVADHCGVSVSAVTQMFQKKTDTTFHAYLTQRRMAAALRLMAADVPLEEIGRQVGYADHSSFYRAFKQIYGVSPREYRKKMTAK